MDGHEASHKAGHEASSHVAAFHYLQARPENKHQPIPFDVEYILSLKNKDTRHLPVIDVRNLGAGADDVRLDIENAGFQYVRHPSAFLDEVVMSGRDATDTEDITDQEWTNIYANEFRDLVYHL